MNRASVALPLILIGLALVCVGLLAFTGALSWFGRLPGDVHVERPGMRLYAPITSMLLISIVISIVAAIIRRFLP